MDSENSERKLLQTARGIKQDVPPIWMMRQAGRHLPEYLELRSRAKDFLDFCFSPSLASEATLQPIRRYGMDGAILFADILLILDALERNVRFVTGEGPVVDPVETADAIARIPASKVSERLSPVYETVSRVRSQLPDETTLIGFAGSPWTVMVYGLEGRGGTDKKTAKMAAYQRPQELDAMLNIIADHTIEYLQKQYQAGADVLMLFDSWAEGLPDSVFQRLVIAPTKRIVDGLRQRGVTAPIIGFPRGGAIAAPLYARETNIDVLGLDTSVPPDWARTALPSNLPVQGCLDPLLLISGGEELTQRTRLIVDSLSDRPHIFNLGHGIHPETPIAHVEQVIQAIRER